MFDVFYFGKKPNLFPHERRVVDLNEARKKSTTRYFWIVDYLCDYKNFDFLWEPAPWESQYIHTWASQWQSSSGTYLCPTSQESGIKYHESPIIKRVNVADGWEIPDNVDDLDFDYTWHPDANDPPYIYQFGTQHQKTGGPKFVVYGASEVKFVDYPRVKKQDIDSCWEISDEIDDLDFDYTWHPDANDPPYIYQFGTQHQKTGGPRYVMKGADSVKFVASPRSRKISIDSCWEISDELDDLDFDYTWHPDANDPPYIYQFGTQHQKTGGPRYVMKGASETKYVNNVTAKKQSSTATATYFIDHYDGNLQRSINSIKTPTIDIQTTRYASDYLNTLKRVVKKASGQHEYIWVCSSVCDYSDFDFSWHPEQWQSSMIHVFPSGEQKFGDTFFIPVEEFLNNADKELLDWYPINFVDSVVVNRWEMPIIRHDFDNQVDAVKATEMTSPLAVFTNTHVDVKMIPTVSLWRDKTKTVVPLSEGASSVIVPRESTSHINKQLYDYPYVETGHTHLLQDKPLDIVFISNGESIAEQNWKHLLSVTKHVRNRVFRIDGIDGRVEAYHAALKNSDTEWAFCVFAKLEVDKSFDWSWQPDRLQSSKHYIFNAKNPVNNLEYGHMAMIAYNKRLVLTNTGKGLDFTLDQSHATVNMMSGISHFNNDPWMTWRTAFRECLKLRDSLPNIENEYRLEMWLSVGNGKNGDWSMRGAKDAVEYYDSVNGDFEKLKLSYEWSFLRDMYENAYE